MHFFVRTLYEDVWLIDEAAAMHASDIYIVHASDAYYLPRDSTPHDWSPPNDESTQNTRGLPLRGSIDFRGVHSRASEVIVATSMIDSDYRYTQDAHQKDRRAILQPLFYGNGTATVHSRCCTIAIKKRCPCIQFREKGTSSGGY